MENLADPPRTSVALQFRNINPMATDQLKWNGQPATDLGTATKDQVQGVPQLF